MHKPASFFHDHEVCYSCCNVVSLQGGKKEFPERSCKMTFTCILGVVISAVAAMAVPGPAPPSPSLDAMTGGPERQLPKILRRYYETTRYLNPYRCQPMLSDICKNRFRYNETVFPNLLDHDSEEVAIISLNGESVCLSSRGLLFLKAMVNSCRFSLQVFFAGPF